MKLRGPLVVAVLVFATFFAGYVGTSSATVLCKVNLPECPFGKDLPVPETIEAKMTSTSALFSQSLGASCKVSSLELKTTEDLGFWPEPLLAEITGWKFSSCGGSCSTVTAFPPFEAEFEAIQDGSPANFHGNGALWILFPKIKLSGCTGGFACEDSAASIVFKVSGGSPMKLIASSVPMSVSGSSCGNRATFSAEYSLMGKFEPLWVEPVP